MSMVTSLEDRIKYATDYLRLCIVNRAPRDTGNLAKNCIRISEDTIQVGGELAEYAIYTNEPWISPKWNGKTNPNEGWLQDAIDNALPTIRMILGGVYSAEDIEKRIQQEKDIQYQIDIEEAIIRENKSK